MNETLKTILNRRSIRKFQETQIEEEKLSAILEAGKFAPCGLNQQSTFFTVVQNKELLDRINDVSRRVYLNSGIPTFVERAKAENFCVYYGAPTFVFVCGEKDAAAYVNNGSVALENMLIAAESLGLGASWVHAFTIVFPTAEGQALKAALGIPDHHEFVGAAALGYKDMPQPQAAPRREGTVTILR